MSAVRQWAVPGVLAGAVPNRIHSENAWPRKPVAQLRRQRATGGAAADVPGQDPGSVPRPGQGCQRSQRGSVQPRSAWGCQRPPPSLSPLGREAVASSRASSWVAGKGRARWPSFDSSW